MAKSKQNSMDWAGLELECADVTLTGDAVVAGDLSVSGAINGQSNAIIATDDVTLTAATSGTTYFIATDAKTFSLPAAATAGIGTWYRFVNSGADANNIITIDPDGTEAIWGTITLAASVVDLGGGAGKALINTKASSIKGDSVTIMTDGVGWFVLASTGIWAAEA
jgi:hypothetical protein